MTLHLNEEPIEMSFFIRLAIILRSFDAKHEDFELTQMKSHPPS